jgi:hypothetical protein
VTVLRTFALLATLLVFSACTEIDRYFYVIEQKTTPAEVDHQELSFFANTSEALDINGVFASPPIRAEDQRYNLFAWSGTSNLVKNRRFIGTATNLKPADGAPLLITAGEGVTTEFAVFTPYSELTNDEYILLAIGGETELTLGILVGYASVTGPLTGKKIIFDMRNPLGIVSVEVDGSAAGETFDYVSSISIDGGDFQGGVLYELRTKEIIVDANYPKPITLSKQELEDGKTCFLSAPRILPQSLAGKKLTITGDSGKSYQWTIPQTGIVKANTITLFKLSLTLSGFVMGVVDNAWEEMEVPGDVVTPS